MGRTTVLFLLLVCAGRGGESVIAQGVDPRARRAEMQDHYSQLLAIHDAVVQGDLDAARGPATELAYLSVPVGSPLATSTFGAAVRDGARRVAREATVVGAARATTAIIRACAECHRASGAAISADAIARRRRDVPDDMADHVRAADDLLLGLLLPSDVRWMTGADRLQSSVLASPGGGPSAADDTLRYLTDRSRRSTTPAARASNYVQLLTTCAECHRRPRR
jgi:cytochrome c553